MAGLFSPAIRQRDCAVPIGQRGWRPVPIMPPGRRLPMMIGAAMGSMPQLTARLRRIGTDELKPELPLQD
jgi:hypothetical protein